LKTHCFCRRMARASGWQKAGGTGAVGAPPRENSTYARRRIPGKSTRPASRSLADLDKPI
jgi:hypothetical protein